MEHTLADHLLGRVQDALLRTGFAAVLLLPEAGADRVWGGEPGQRADPVVVNSARPTGRAAPVDGGYALTGRWDLVSGIDSADWVALFALAEPALDVRVFFLPRSAVGVLDTWQVTGMRGTGSNSIASTGCATVVLGIARAGLDALVELATGKPTDNGATLAHRAHAQAAIAGADAAPRACCCAPARPRSTRPSARGRAARTAR
ncbi:hypothetical protein [Pseudonocardia sp.]|uniref:hypothetical protein n=1 Tax=Pseudonocardia sp. TaxID=60912 RepID=UPI003D0CA903